MIWALTAVSILAAVPAGLRWLRVAQREHYLAGEATRSAGRWRRAGPVNFGVELAGFAAMIAMILSVVADDAALSRARLRLVEAVQVTLRQTLGLLGITAPDRM